MSAGEELSRLFHLPYRRAHELFVISGEVETSLAFLTVKDPSTPLCGARNDTERMLRVQIFVVIFALRRELDGLLAAGLRILEDFSFVIADHDFLVVVIENVTGIDRHFAAAAGRVDHVLRNGVTGGVTTQAFDDLDSFRDR